MCKDNMFEDKEIITVMLCKALSSTRMYYDLAQLVYVEDDNEERVIIIFRNGSVKRCYVTGDSGIALIEDVLECLKTGQYLAG